MKPILFNTKMVKAILDGRKTVTRRLVKPQPPATAHVLKVKNDYGWSIWKDNPEKHRMKPLYQTGEILWVRETWCESLGQAGKYFYRAYAGPRDEMKEYAHSFNRWRPSIHMPREAARIFLRVTGVRVEHLQEITTSQARAEGQPKCPGSIAICGKFHGCQHCEAEISNAVLWFESVWNETIPKHPNEFKRYPYYYEDDPWVWVIEFKRISKEEAEQEDGI